MRKNILVYIFIVCFCALAHGQNDSSENSIPDISSKEKIVNFSVVYVAQWVYYLTVHEDEIEKYGSFENWTKNPWDPHYDRDSFEYNLIRHTMAGQYYYLFYRSRNYSEQNAFIWSAISSFAFEFTIETVTERPSYQDLYQTPVFGTVLGVGVEKFSNYLHEQDHWSAHLLGYILNPFAFIAPTNNFLGVVLLRSNSVALQVGWEFE